MSYFTNYPSITIVDPITQLPVNISDIFRRVKINSDIANHQTLYKTYYVVDGERPDQIAFNYYGDVKYYWIILLANNINNYTDWAVSNSELENIIYRLPNSTKYYETIEIKDSNGFIVVQSGIKVDSNYNIKIDNIAYSGNRLISPISYAEHEIRINDRKKKIILPLPEIAKQLDNQFLNLISHQTNILNSIGNKFEEI